jgi:ankyrin repeat protein
MLLIVLGRSIPAFCGEIHDAAKAGDLPKVKALLKDNHKLVSRKDKDVETHLHRAADWGHEEVAELLRRRGGRE